MQSPVILVRASGFYSGKHAAVNLGDMAQQVHAVRLLEALFPNYKLVMLLNSLNEQKLLGDHEISSHLPAYLGPNSSGPFERIRQFIAVGWLVVGAMLMRALGFCILRNRHGRAAIEEIHGCSMVFFSGAGAFNQRYLLGPAGLWLLTVVLARLLGKPVVMLGQQVGPFQSRIVRWLFGACLRRVSFLGCRDSESLEFCRTMGLRANSYAYTGDEGGYLAPGDPVDALAMLGEMGVRPGFVAVQFRLDGNTPFESWKVWFSEIVQRVSKALDAQILLVPMAYRGENDDRVALVSIRECFPDAVLVTCEDPALTKAVLGYAAIAIGVANHFVVFAASVGVPAVGIHASEYMRQKLEGAEKRYPHVRAIQVSDCSAEEVAQIALLMARDRDASGKGPAFSPDHPPMYWDWLDRVGGMGRKAKERLSVQSDEN